MLNKEDMGLSQDTEALIQDTPLETYILCFPNEKNPHKKVEEFYRNYFRCHLDDWETISITKGKEAVSRKGHWSTLEIDIHIISLIEQEFNYQLEYEFNVSMDIISSTEFDDLLDKNLMVDKLQYTKFTPDRIRQETLLRSGLITTIERQRERILR